MNVCPLPQSRYTELCYEAIGIKPELVITIQGALSV